jgi:hypothetical protein
LLVLYQRAECFTRWNDGLSILSLYDLWRKIFIKILLGMLAVLKVLFGGRSKEPHD